MQQEVDKLIFFAAVLMGLLIAVAYFTGATTDLNAAVTGVNTLWNTGTGRNAQGVFAAYPTGATSAK